MKTITMELRKRDASGNMVLRVVDLTELNDTLTPEEIFAMETKINEIPSIRAHISVRDEEESHYLNRTTRL